MSSTFTPPSFPLCSPSLSDPSQQYAKNNNSLNEDDQASQVALILLILGIFVPCLWIVNWLIYRNHFNSKARQYAKISGILQLVEIIVGVVLLVLFFTVTGVVAKEMVDSRTSTAQTLHQF